MDEQKLEDHRTHAKIWRPWIQTRRLQLTLTQEGWILLPHEWIGSTL
jgi:hypothetical protein